MGSPAPEDAVAMTTKVSRGAAGSLQKLDFSTSARRQGWERVHGAAA